MKVFLDDEHQMPEGWVRVYWPDEAIVLLRTGKVTQISLGHDLGDDARGTGYDVVLWIEQAVAQDGFIPPAITVHSANTSARAKMEAGAGLIERLAEASQKQGLRKMKDTTFLDKILDEIIIKGRKTPKFQVERAITPFISIFLGEILSALRKGNRISVIASEFPLRKKSDSLESRQSTNADWLAFDASEDKFLLVELKTEIGSFDERQYQTYLELIRTGMEFSELCTDIKEIGISSSQANKYFHLLEQIDITGETINKIERYPVEVIYLAPKSTEEQAYEIPEEVTFHSFSGIQRTIESSYPKMGHSELATLLKYLEKLDHPIKNATPPTSKGYDKLVNFDKIIQLCRQTPGKVGFDGGRNALRKAPLSYLEKRKYKWISSNGALAKGNNWIDSNTFLKEVDNIIESAPKSTTPAQIMERLQVLQKSACGKENIGRWMERALANSLGVEYLDQISDEEWLEAMKSTSQSES